MGRPKKEASERKKQLSIFLTSDEIFKAKQMARVWGITLSQMVASLVNKAYDSESYLQGFYDLSQDERNNLLVKRTQLDFITKRRSECAQNRNLERRNGSERGLANVMVIKAPEEEPYQGIFCRNLGNVWIIPYNMIYRVSVVAVMQYPCYASVFDYFAGRPIAKHELSNFVYQHRDYILSSLGEKAVLDRLVAVYNKLPVSDYTDLSLNREGFPFLDEEGLARLAERFNQDLYDASVLVAEEALYYEDNEWPYLKLEKKLYGFDLALDLAQAHFDETKTSLQNEDGAKQGAKDGSEVALLENKNTEQAKQAEQAERLAQIALFNEQVATAYNTCQLYLDVYFPHYLNQEEHIEQTADTSTILYVIKHFDQIKRCQFAQANQLNTAPYINSKLDFSVDVSTGKVKAQYALPEHLSQATLASEISEIDVDTVPTYDELAQAQVITLNEIAQQNERVYSKFVAKRLARLIDKVESTFRRYPLLRNKNSSLYPKAHYIEEVQSTQKSQEPSELSELSEDTSNNVEQNTVASFENSLIKGNIGDNQGIGQNISQGTGQGTDYVSTDASLKAKDFVAESVSKENMSEEDLALAQLQDKAKDLASQNNDLSKDELNALMQSELRDYGFVTDEQRLIVRIDQKQPHIFAQKLLSLDLDFQKRLAQELFELRYNAQNKEAERLISLAHSSADIVDEYVNYASCSSALSAIFEQVFVMPELAEGVKKKGRGRPRRKPLVPEFNKVINSSNLGYSGTKDEKCTTTKVLHPSDIAKATVAEPDALEKISSIKYISRQEAQQDSKPNALLEENKPKIRASQAFKSKQDRSPSAFLNEVVHNQIEPEICPSLIIDRSEDALEQIEDEKALVQNNEDEQALVSIDKHKAVIDNALMLNKHKLLDKNKEVYKYSSATLEDIPIQAKEDVAKEPKEATQEVSTQDVSEQEALAQKNAIQEEPKHELTKHEYTNSRITKDVLFTHVLSLVQQEQHILEQLTSGDSEPILEATFTHGANFIQKGQKALALGQLIHKTVAEPYGLTIPQLAFTQGLQVMSFTGVWSCIYNLMTHNLYCKEVSLVQANLLHVVLSSGIQLPFLIQHVPLSLQVIMRPYGMSNISLNLKPGTVILDMEVLYACTYRIVQDVQLDHTCYRQEQAWSLQSYPNTFYLF